MSFGIGLILMFLITGLALNGSGYRGLYIAGALMGFVLGAGCVMISPSDAEHARNLASGDPNMAAGSRLLYAIGLDAAIVWFFGGFGSLLGAALYRTPTGRQRAERSAADQREIDALK